MTDLSKIKIDAADDARLGSPAAAPEPLHSSMPESMFAKPVEPTPAKLTAYQHFTAALRILDDADIGALEDEETDFVNFGKDPTNPLRKPAVGSDVAGAFADLCDYLNHKRRTAHMAGELDPYIVKNGDSR